MNERLGLDVSALLEASGLLNLSLDPSETLALIARGAADVAGAASSNIELLGPSGHLETGAAWGLPPGAADRLTDHLARLSRRVIEAGKALLLPVAGQEAGGWPPTALAEAGCLSSLALPLSAKERVGGVLWLHFARPCTFADEEVGLLSLFANQAAMAIANSRLHSDLRLSKASVEGSKRSLEELHRVSVAIQESLSAQERLDFILQGAREVLALDRIAIFLADAALNALECAAAVGLPDPPPPLRVPLAPPAGALSLAFADQQEFVLLGDEALPPSLTLPAPYAGIELLRTRSFVVLPLVVRGQAIGVLAADNKTSRRPLTPEVVGLLRIFAAQAGIAIENARLFEDSQRRAREATALAEVARALSASLDMDRVLEIIVQEVQRVMAAPCVGIMTLDEGGQELAYVKGAGLSSERIRGVRLKVGEGIAGRAVEQGAPVQSSNLLQDPRDVYPDITVAEGFRSQLCTPLLAHGRALGVLVLFRQDEHEFAPAEVQLLANFADQAALALQNARLYAEVRGYSQELERKVEERTRELQALNRELAAASRHKSEFLAQMSHELRTPLNSIIGFSEMLGAQGSGELNAKQARYVENVRKGGQHLLNLINDVLDLSKVEAGRIELRPKLLALPEVLEDAMDIMRTEAVKKCLALELCLPEGVGPIVADPLRLKQILHNLLSNAVKSTPEGGRIVVSARRLPSEGAGRQGGRRGDSRHGPSGDVVEVAVADTGIGIAPEDQARLFEDYVQLASSHGQGHEGTGLGLAVAKRLIELHGGRIWVESEGKGCGSTFTFALPAPGPPPPSAGAGG